MGPGEGPGRPPPLILDQTEAQRAEKKICRDLAPPYLRVWMTGPTPPLSEGLDLPLNASVVSCREMDIVERWPRLMEVRLYYVTF